MAISTTKLNTFLMLKLPAAYFTGVRTTYLDHEKCIVKVRHRWINQNPFRSMFWAVQGMAAELATGALVMNKIRDRKKNISMLVLKNNASFSKKAKGKVTFTCTEGHKIDEAINKAITSGEGETVWLNAIGMDENGDEVSNFNFQWTLKLKS